MTRMTRAEKEVYAAMLAKHQRKHPGCKLNEKRCRFEYSNKCVGKADLSYFKGASHMCQPCRSWYNHQYYAKSVAEEGRVATQKRGRPKGSTNKSQTKKKSATKKKKKSS
jgi:hypothetical protein